METKKRIEWIDAMRGFTMLLVVYAHVQFFGLGLESDETFNQVLILFRMPLFFFISGFILYKVAAIWDGANAWTFLKGSKAPVCAGIIHSDFERGFIRAETISYDDFVKYGSEQACKDAGKMRSEGKDYVVKDGDMMNFLFNV